MQRFRFLASLFAALACTIAACSGEVGDIDFSGDDAGAEPSSGESGSQGSSDKGARLVDGGSDDDASQEGDGGEPADASADSSVDASDDGGQPDAGPDASDDDASTEKECTWGAPDACPLGTYCFAPGCGKGVCRARLPTLRNELDPVCGCDNITYYNSAIARAKGMAPQSRGVCQTPILCSPTSSCPPDSNCNLQVAEAKDCRGNRSTQGACWVAPRFCPSGNGPHAWRGCGAAACTSLCTLIRSETPHYVDPSCPTN